MPPSIEANGALIPKPGPPSAEWNVDNLPPPDPLELHRTILKLYTPLRKLLRHPAHKRNFRLELIQECMGHHLGRDQKRNIIFERIKRRMAYSQPMNKNGTRVRSSGGHRGRGAILGHSSHDVRFANSNDNGGVFLLPLRQDQDVHMISDEDLHPELHSASDQWIGDKHIPLTFNEEQNHTPLPRSPGLYLPWRKERVIADACQASNEQGPSNLTDFKPSAGHRKALLIGITYQQTTMPRDQMLTFPWNDVELMENMLIENFHYKPENIVVMTDEPSTPECLQPTRGNILREMNKLVQTPGDKDDFFLYYAGHATQQEERVEGNERDQRDECLIPIDNDLIIDDELYTTLVKPLLDSGKDCQLIAIMDTCTSGTLLDLEHDICNENNFKGTKPKKQLSEISTGGKNAKNDSNHARFCDGNCSGKGENIKATIMCISACRDSQSIVEYEEGSTLAGVLHDYLKENNEPSLKGLYLHICVSLKGNHSKLLAKIQNEANQIQSQCSLPTEPPRSPSPQISSMKPLEANMAFRPRRHNSGCH